MKKIKRGYRKVYRLRVPVPGRNSVEVTFPFEVVEKEARDHNLSIPEFLKRFKVVALYDNFDGVHYHFEETQGE